MRPKSIILLLLALGCGLVASIGISQVIRNRGGGANGEVETTPIFVASKEILLGHKLTTENVNLEKWPKEKVPEGAFTELGDLDGRRSQVRVIAGMPITEAMLADAGRQVGAEIKIPPGYVVVAVKATATTVAGNLILPGDHVNVMVYVRANPREGIPASIAKTFLQDIQVFAVNSDTERTSTGEENKATTATTVSLLVTPKQGEKLALAEELGKIRLFMRNGDDDTEHQVAEATSKEELLGDESEINDREALKGPTARIASDDHTAGQQQLAPPFRMVFLEGPSMRVMEFADGENAPRQIGGSSAHAGGAVPPGFQPPANGAAPGLQLPPGVNLPPGFNLPPASGAPPTDSTRGGGALQGLDVGNDEG